MVSAKVNISYKLDAVQLSGTVARGKRVIRMLVLYTQPSIFIDLGMILIVYVC